MKALLLAFSMLLASSLTAIAAPTSLSTDWHSGVDKVFGSRGEMKGRVVKFTFPRSDLDVRMAGMAIEPAFGLTSWVAFQPTGTGEAIMMGDLVATTGEVKAITDKALKEGISISAIHRHIIGETPQVSYIHIGGTGDPTTLARKVKSVLEATGTPLTPAISEAPAVRGEQGAASTDWSKVENILGRSGEVKAGGDVITFMFPRRERVKDMGVELQPAMGIGSAIYFQAAGDKTLASGDFALIGSEVEPVMKTLADNGFTVSALHTHMINESPKLYYMHFFGEGDRLKLAKGLRTALEQTSSIMKITVK